MYSGMHIHLEREFLMIPMPVSSLVDRVQLHLRLYDLSYSSSQAATANLNLVVH